MRYLGFFLIFISVLTCNAQEGIIQVDKNDKVFLIKGSDIENIGCVLCDFLPQIDEDIDNDGLRETILLYRDWSDEICIEFCKYKENEILFSDSAKIKLPDDLNLATDGLMVEIILHDFDKDSNPEIIIGFTDGQIIEGYVYKLNGKNVNWENLAKSLENSDLRVKNLIEDIGSFGGFDDCRIYDDTIYVKRSMTGNLYTRKYDEIIFKNGKLYNLHRVSE